MRALFEDGLVLALVSLFLTLPLDAPHLSLAGFFFNRSLGVSNTRANSSLLSKSLIPCRNQNGERRAMHVE